MACCIAIFTVFAQPVRQYLIYIAGFQRNANELTGQSLKIATVPDQYPVAQEVTGDGFRGESIQFCQDK